ncbi:MAG: 4-(cytidine 5'-diphospho)-2-C-methyl-D-erythritol kinase [Desulfobacteraceae bacterium]|nr:4-(cytidine 5'-diphospho)-2-C-methyl-D-erythritol kinase [Desulfobacteraceae bacterium]
MVTILSPAKINCFLYITGKRDDGYHELASLMTSLEFYDEIEIKETVDKRIEVICSHPDVPEDESNIAYKAASLFYENLSLSEMNKESTGKNGVSIKIKKKIPVGAGLGGGSSNAASVLMTLSQLHGNIFSTSQLMEMSLLLGADVPFFIFNSPAIARGIGEKLTKCGTLLQYYILLCYPGVSASTHKVFKNFDIKLTEKRKLDIDIRLNIWDKSKKIDVAEYMHNDLEDVACRLYPDIKYTKEEMEFVLSEKVCMTGSGSSLFAFFVDYEKAKKAYSLLLDRWKGSRKEVILTSFKI